MEELIDTMFRSYISSASVKPGYNFVIEVKKIDKNLNYFNFIIGIDDPSLTTANDSKQLIKLLNINKNIQPQDIIIENIPSDLIFRKKEQYNIPIKTKNYLVTINKLGILESNSVIFSANMRYDYFFSTSRSSKFNINIKTEMITNNKKSNKTILIALFVIFLLAILILFYKKYYKN